MAGMNRSGVPISRVGAGKGPRTKRAAMKAAARRRTHLERALRASSPDRDDDR